jgi:cytochrome c55X
MAMSRCPALAFSALTLLAPVVCAAPDDADAAGQAELARGWAALRAMDCARCHGRDHDGWAAPSLIAAVREGTRERFAHYVLEGDLARGMPSYRSQPLVVAELDAIYAYLRARAAGAIGTGSPARAPGRLRRPAKRCRQIRARGPRVSRSSPRAVMR